MIWESFEMPVDVTVEWHVPMVQWGKDHWSVFAYLECCAVDNKGIINNQHMRCNP